MKRLALLCLLIAGCGTVHASSIRPARIKAKRPAAVKKVSTAAGETAPSVSKGAESSPAAALPKSRIEDAIQKKVERDKADLEDRFIDGLEKAPIDDSEPPPGPPPDPNPAPSPGDAPFLTLPPTIEGEVLDFIEITAHTNCKRVTYIVVDKGLKKFPDSVLADPLSTVVSGMNNGSYRVIAFAAKADVVVTAETIVMLHGAQPPPQPVPPPIPPPQPVPPPPPAPPPAPPSPAVAKLWVVVVSNIIPNPGDNVTPRVIGDVSFWNAVRAQGHEYRNYNPTQPEYQKYRDIVARNGGVPVVILMNADDTSGHNWLNKNPGEFGMPQSGTAGIKALINKYSVRQIP